MGPADASIRDLVLDPTIGVEERARRIAAALDARPLDRQIAALDELGGRRAQQRLWEAAAYNGPVTTADLVAPTHTAMRPVVFHGRNSLPAFTRFKKICVRPPSGTPGDVLWGYNDTPIRPAIGDRQRRDWDRWYRPRSTVGETRPVAQSSISRTIDRAAS